MLRVAKEWARVVVIDITEDPEAARAEAAAKADAYERQLAEKRRVKARRARKAASTNRRRG